MRFQYTSYFLIFIIIALSSVLIAYMAFRRRHSTPASYPFTLMMLAIAEYATVAGLESAAITIADKVFWSKLEYVGSGSVITLFLIFAIHFSRQKAWLTHRRAVLLWTIPILNMFLVATNEWHQLVWTGFLPGPPGSNLVVYQHGPGFFWVMACVYAYVLTSSFILAKAALRPSRLYRQQSSLMLAGAIMPLVGGSLYMLELSPPGLNITPMSFLLTGVIYFASLFRFRMFDLVPIARDVLVERMNDGVFVLDAQNRIVDINPAAQQMIGLKVRLGQSAQQGLARWPQMVQLCNDVQNDTVEMIIDPDRHQFLELHISALRDHRGGLTGRLVVLRDITQRYQAELELRSANQRLQSQLQEIQSLQDKLREQAIRDKLTGLFNRRYFEETLPRELTRAVREAYPVAVILMDIDYFKQINDTYGHQAGDRVLQAFGELLLSQVRFGDIACRYGGEEFVFALPGMPLEAAYQRAEQIRLSFQALQIIHEEQQITVTVSGGIALFPTDGKTSSDLLRVADQGLYAAKAAGRNCIQLPKSTFSRILQS